MSNRNNLAVLPRQVLHTCVLKDQRISRCSLTYLETSEWAFESLQAKSYTEFRVLFRTPARGARCTL
jgi:hypothetical protein